MFWTVGTALIMKFIYYIIVLELMKILEEYNISSMSPIEWIWEKFLKKTVTQEINSDNSLLHCWMLYLTAIYFPKEEKQETFISFIVIFHDFTVFLGSNDWVKSIKVAQYICHTYMNLLNW